MLYTCHINDLIFHKLSLSWFWLMGQWIPKKMFCWERLVRPLLYRSGRIQMICSASHMCISASFPIVNLVRVKLLRTLFNIFGALINSNNQVNIIFWTFSLSWKLHKSSDQHLHLKDIHIPIWLCFNQQQMGSSSSDLISEETRFFTNNLSIFCVGSSNNSFVVFGGFIFFLGIFSSSS